ncbi:hypothetical protein ACHAW6_008293 [Cyclotella cf. meneghiniana]
MMSRGQHHRMGMGQNVSRKHRSSRQVHRRRKHWTRRRCFCPSHVLRAEHLPLLPVWLHFRFLCGSVGISCSRRPQQGHQSTSGINIFFPLMRPDYQPNFLIDQIFFFPFKQLIHDITGSRLCNWFRIGLLRRLSPLFLGSIRCKEFLCKTHSPELS